MSDYGTFRGRYKVVDSLDAIREIESFASRRPINDKAVHSIPFLSNEALRCNFGLFTHPAFLSSLVIDPSRYTHVTTVQSQHSIPKDVFPLSSLLCFFLPLLLLRG